MLNRFRQTGAFILVTIVFLMVAGGAMLYAMSNLSSVSSTTTTLAHNGNMALAAAQSGLKYCLYQLEMNTACTPNPIITPTLPAPCTITIAEGCFAPVVPPSTTCTVTSTAYCPDTTDASRGAKKLSIQVQKTTGGYQMIPASRLVLPVP